MTWSHPFTPTPDSDARDIAGYPMPVYIPGNVKTILSVVIIKGH